MKKQQKTDPKAIPSGPKAPPLQVTAPSFKISFPPVQPQIQETVQTFPLDNDPKVRKNYLRKSEIHGRKF